MISCDSFKIDRGGLIKFLEANDFDHDSIGMTDRYKLSVTNDLDVSVVMLSLEVTLYNDCASAYVYVTTKGDGLFSRTADGIYYKSFDNVLSFVNKYMELYGFENIKKKTMMEQDSNKEKSIIEDIDGQLPKETNEFNMSSFLDDLQTLINKYRKYV